MIRYDPFRLREKRADERQRQDEAVAQSALRENGFVPCTELSAEDIFVTGYPKSGNTWFQILMSVLIFGADAELTPFKIIGDMVPDLSARRYYRRHARTMFYKSHALPAPEYRKVVYLLRDGRDVMVSYKHYREVIDRTEYDFAAFVSSEHPLWPCHWAHHVEEWAKNPYDAQIIVIRYEDMLVDTARELERLCAFAGIERSAAQIADAVASTSLASLRRKEKTEGNWDPNYRSSKPFFRRGAAGSHADEMPPDVLKAFLAHASPTLERFGYALS